MDESMWRGTRRVVGTREVWMRRVGPCGRPSCYLIVRPLTIVRISIALKDIGIKARRTPTRAHPSALHRPRPYTDGERVASWLALNGPFSELCCVVTVHQDREVLITVFDQLQSSVME